MLRQIEWGVQNGPFTKNGALPVTTSFFGKFCFSLRTWYKELYQPPKCPYSYFSKALQFHLRVLFPCEYPQNRCRGKIETVKL